VTFKYKGYKYAFNNSRFRNEQGSGRASLLPGSGDKSQRPNCPAPTSDHAWLSRPGQLVVAPEGAAKLPPQVTNRETL